MTSVSFSEFTFTFIVTIIISVFVPGRSRTVQKLKKWVCTTRDRPGTKTEIIIVTINVKVNSEEDTFAEIYCTCLPRHLSCLVFFSLTIRHIRLSFGNVHSIII